MNIEDVREAMGRLHERDHAILGSLMVYLHANTTTDAERAAVINHAVDAAFNLAMMLTEESNRELVREQLVRRVLSSDVSIYPSTAELSEQKALNGLFRMGLEHMANDDRFMDVLGALLLARKQGPGVNDKLH